MLTNILSNDQITLYEHVFACLLHKCALIMPDLPFSNQENGKAKAQEVITVVWAIKALGKSQ